MKIERFIGAFTAAVALALSFLTVAHAQTPPQAPTQKPNIVIIWGDDIGQSNVSAYSRGLMGYQTPNIDRIANEGMMFTDIYAEQSCTAGRSSFITGQSGLRTGLTKVGLPGATLGLRKEDQRIVDYVRIAALEIVVAQAAVARHIDSQDEQLSLPRKRQSAPFWPFRCP